MAPRLEVGTFPFGAGYCLTHTEIGLMPSAIKRPCTHPGCNELTTEGRCARHKKQEQQTYDRYQRDPEAKRFYNSGHWKALSSACKQRAKGLCEACFAIGALTAGNQADHIVPRSRGGKDELDNLQWLCIDCHARKSAAEGSRWQRHDVDHREG